MVCRRPAVGFGDIGEDPDVQEPGKVSVRTSHPSMRDGKIAFPAMCSRNVLGGLPRVLGDGAAGASHELFNQDAARPLHLAHDGGGPPFPTARCSGSSGRPRFRQILALVGTRAPDAEWASEGASQRAAAAAGTG